MQINQIVKEIMYNNGKLNNLPLEEKFAMEKYLQSKLEQPHIQHSIYKIFKRKLHEEDIRYALSRDVTDWNEDTVQLLTNEYEEHLDKYSNYDTTAEYIICKYLDKLEI